jgi:hypothetical protein
MIGEKRRLMDVCRWENGNSGMYELMEGRDKPTEEQFAAKQRVHGARKKKKK